MLINSYMVLGDKEKAATALAKARSVFANQADAQPPSRKSPRRML
jgi:hypothetical protein